MKKWNLFLCTLMSLCTSCGHQEKMVLLGSWSHESVEMIEAEQSNLLTAFTSPNMVSNELYKIAETRSIALENGKKYSFEKQIRSADSIVIAIGYYDFVPYLQIDPKQCLFEEDEEQIERQFSLLAYNVYHTLEEIRSLNAKANIYLLNSYISIAFEEPEQKLFRTFLQKVEQCLLGAMKDHLVQFIPTYLTNQEEEYVKAFLRYVV